MKVGGQILWNVTPICETSQIYSLMGRSHMKDVSGMYKVHEARSLGRHKLMMCHKHHGSRCT